MAKIFPYQRAGFPSPFLITPRNADEAQCGKATLLTDGQIYMLLGALKGSRKWNDPDLIEKLQDLAEN